MKQDRRKAIKQLSVVAFKVRAAAKTACAKIADLPCWLIDDDSNVHVLVAEELEMVQMFRQDADDIDRIVKLLSRNSVRAVVAKYEALDTAARDEIWEGAPAFRSFVS
jgi:hypothetical protein